MGITDVFKTKQMRSEIEQLTSENEYLKSIATPEMVAASNIHNEIQRLRQQQQLVQNELSELQRQNQSLNLQIQEKQKRLVILDDEALYQEFSLYTPVYDLMNSESYKDRISIVRQKQKDMIKRNTAATFPSNFTYNNSLAQGKKLVADNVKQILRAFNNECEAIIDKVKFNNVESIRKRIIKSYEDLNKLNAKMSIAITPSYLDLKLQEMNLCYEYSIKKQEEKEEAKRIREEQREAQKLQREIDEARKNSEKERAHYTNALRRIESQLQRATGSDRDLLEARRSEIQSQITAIEEELRQIDYREANQRAGYVYVISNIGSFGQDIYKIGMTRRLDPMDRVDELGDASVPFQFDVHAMIFSDDAPALEAALHRAFDKKKVNMVNTRREFFHVTLAEIEEVVRKNFDKTVEFVKTPSAEQFRESQMMRRELGITPLEPHYATPDSIIPPVTTTPSSQPVAPSCTTTSTPVSTSLPTLDPNKKYLHTKWGIYEMPSNYKIKLTYGAPIGLQRVQ